MTKRGWVDSVRGAGGGVKLAVDPASITIQDVVDATGDNFFVKVCLSEESSCQRKSTCPCFLYGKRHRKPEKHNEEHYYCRSCIRVTKPFDISKNY